MKWQAHFNKVIEYTSLRPYFPTEVPPVRKKNGTCLFISLCQLLISPLLLKFYSTLSTAHLVANQLKLRWPSVLCHHIYRWKIGYRSFFHIFLGNNLLLRACSTMIEHGCSCFKKDQKLFLLFGCSTQNLGPL